MANNKFMGTFDSETEVLRKIEELKAQGSSENDMFVMARDKDQISMVRGRTDVDYKSSEGNWMDKFKGFLSGDEPTREAFSGMGLDSQETDRYYQEVQNGKILLFVDREFGASYEGDAPYDNSTYSNTGSGRPGYVDTGAVGQDGLTVDTNDQNDVIFHKEHDSVTSDDTTVGSRFDRQETAGVGEDTGTGFGLGREDASRDDTFSDRDSASRASFAGNDASFTGNEESLSEEERLRLHEERLNVNKERVQTGEVNVGKHVVEEEQTIEVPVEREEVYIERRPVNEQATDANLTGDAYQEGETIHVPVSEERVDVSKTDVVSEEIVVGKRKVEDTETVRETLRHEEADIDEDTNLNRNNLDRDKLDRDDLDRNKKDRF